MKIKFREARISRANRERLSLVNSIIEEYQAAGYVLTLRQLYYQLVSRDVIPNLDTEYAKLSNLLKEGRMGGIVDWDAIEDRLRQPNKPSSWSTPENILDSAIHSYTRDLQEGQPTYIEVWVEKDALSGVLKRVTHKYHIPIMVNRGYSSVSAMYDAYNRFVRNGVWEARPIKILYLGDFDPSGLDMIRDIADRTNEFKDGADFSNATPFDFSVRHIALTMPQIEEHTPPPNPAKIKDPRATDFIAKYGGTSWEVDALRPEVLHSVLENAILEEMDMERYEQAKHDTEEGKNKLKSLKKYL